MSEAFVHNGHRITIPQAVWKPLNIEVGDVVEFQIVKVIKAKKEMSE